LQKIATNFFAKYLI